MIKNVFGNKARTITQRRGYLVSTAPSTATERLLTPNNGPLVRMALQLNAANAGN